MKATIERNPTVEVISGKDARLIGGLYVKGKDHDSGSVFLFPGPDKPNATPIIFDGGIPYASQFEEWDGYEFVRFNGKIVLTN